MGVADLDVKIVAKVKGMWKLAFLTLLMRHVSARHIVHVHLNDGRKATCVQVVQHETTPKLSGQ